MKIEYYFSVLSPFTYLGADRFTKIVSQYNLEVIEKPLDLVGEIFPNTGGLPVPKSCLLYTSPSPRDGLLSRMPSSA